MNEQTDFSVWMVRAGSGGFLIDEFWDLDIVAVGWNELGEISTHITYNELKDKFRKEYDDSSDGKINQSVGQIWRFVKEFKLGDKVVTYEPATRFYYLGEIVSEYQFSSTYTYHHFRKVKWQDLPTERDVLSIDTKNILGSILTIFQLPLRVWEELNINNKKEISEVEKRDIEDELQDTEKASLEALKDDVVSRSKEFIKDILANLSWQDTEILVGGLLKSLGYKIRMTSKGSDLGSDIIAATDVLGLEGPQIKVEVKKRTNSKIGADDIRAFIGGLRGHHKGIYVSTGGFSKEAKYEAERANFSITLIDSEWLVELVTTNYELLDLDIKALVPLKKIYWPV